MRHTGSVAAARHMVEPAVGSENIGAELGIAIEEVGCRLYGQYR